MDNFGYYTLETTENYNILIIHIIKSQPTHLQWLYFVDGLKQNLEQLRLCNKKIGILFDVKYVSILKIEYIKEYTSIFEKNHELLQNNLLCTCVYNNNPILKCILEIVLKFYKSKKEIIFIKQNQYHEIFNKKYMDNINVR